MQITTFTDFIKSLMAQSFEGWSEDAINGYLTACETIMDKFKQSPSQYTFETPVGNSNLPFQSSDGWVVSHIDNFNNVVVTIKNGEVKSFPKDECLFFNNAFGYGNENRPVSAEYAVLHNNNGF